MKLMQTVVRNADATVADFAALTAIQPNLVLAFAFSSESHACCCTLGVHPLEVMHVKLPLNSLKWCKKPFRTMEHP